MIKCSLTDYELVKNFKEEENQKYAKILYQRYLPLIRKFSVKVSFRGKDQGRKEDFEQDAFFKIIKCLDNININKIPEQIVNTWKFGFFYKFHLLNLMTKYCKRTSKNYFYVNIDNIVDENYKDIDNYIHKKDMLECSMQEVLNSSRFSDMEKDIFFKKLLEGYTFDELAAVYNMPDIKYYFYKILDFVTIKLRNKYGPDLFKNIKLKNPKNSITLD
jgi:DNA-directed RNA polymerase specialized sigma24 family protein